MISHTPYLSLVIGCDIRFQLSGHDSQGTAAVGGDIGGRTELSNQDSLLRIRCPLAVGDRAILCDVEAKLEIALGELVVSTLNLVNGVLPLSEETVTMENVGNLLLEPWVDSKNGLLVEGRGGHGGDGERERARGRRGQPGHWREGGEQRRSLPCVFGPGGPILGWDASWILVPRRHRSRVRTFCHLRLPPRRFPGSSSRRACGAAKHRHRDTDATLVPLSSLSPTTTVSAAVCTRSRPMRARCS